MNEHGNRTSRNWLLIGSLMANMLLVGLIAGSAISQRTGSSAAPPERVELRLARDVLQTASREDRRRIARLLVQALRENRQLVATRAEARRALAGALSASPYDEGAVRAAFAALNDADHALQAAIQDTLAGEMASLTQEQRALLANRLAEPGIGRGGLRRGRRQAED